MAEPSLDSVTAAICPYDKPYKCLPYGICQGLLHRCDSVTHSLKDCIDPKIRENRVLLTNYCKQHPNGEGDVQCSSACSTLLNLTDFRNECKYEPMRCDTPFWIYVVIALLLIVIVLLLIVAVRYYRKYKILDRKQLYSSSSTPAPSESEEHSGGRWNDLPVVRQRVMSHDLETQTSSGATTEQESNENLEPLRSSSDGNTSGLGDVVTPTDEPVEIFNGSSNQAINAAGREGSQQAFIQIQNPPCQESVPMYTSHSVGTRGAQILT